MEELQAQSADVAVQVMDQRHDPGTVRQERLLHGGHILAELVTLGCQHSEVRLLSRAGEDTAN
eukprot:2384108-Amphidinium_carterae.1